MHKKLVLLVLVITLLFPVLVRAETFRDKATSNNEILLNDTAGVFTKEQFDKLKTSTEPLLEKANVMVLTRRSAGERNINIVAKEEYQKAFGTKNGIIIVMNIYNGADSTGRNDDWHNHMTVWGFGSIIITDDQRNEIYQNNSSLVKKANFLEAAEQVIQNVCKYNNIVIPEKESVNVSSVNGVVLEDDADLLTEAEEKQLVDIMTPLTEYGHIIFKTIDKNDMTAEQYAHHYYYDHFGNESGTMLLIDMYNRYIYICSAGNNYNVITNTKADIITDNIYQYASNKEYFKCAQEAFTEIKVLLDGGKIAEPMRYASNIVISLVLGFLLTFLFVANSMRIKKPSRKRRLNSAEKYVALANIVGRKTGSHRVYSPISDNDSSSGGFSSGGGFSGGGGHSSGGGGGFSGGGGGHRF